MISFIVRHRAGFTFLVILLGLLSLIAGQVPASEEQTILTWVIYAAVSPVQHAASYVVFGIRSLWEDYIDLRTVRVENKLLREEITEIHLENQRLLRKLEMAEGLSAIEEDQKAFLERMKELDPSDDYRTISAMVIGAGVNSSSHTILLNRGSLDGVLVDQGVISHRGAVGRVLRAGPNTCLVQLLTDPGFAAAARLGHSRVRAIIHGTGREDCELLYIKKDDSVQKGDEVLTSGLEGIFPSEVPVGIVSGVEEGDPPFQRVYVKPLTSFRSLEWVYVVLKATEPEKLGVEQ